MTRSDLQEGAAAVPRGTRGSLTPKRLTLMSAAYFVLALAYALFSQSWTTAVVIGAVGAAAASIQFQIAHASRHQRHQMRQLRAGAETARLEIGDHVATTRALLEEVSQLNSRLSQTVERHALLTSKLDIALVERRTSAPSSDETWGY